MILTNSPETLARADMLAYKGQLKIKGKTLDTAAQDRLFGGARDLYAAFGRMDFASFRDNVGSGDIAYTFHRKVFSLISSPSWVSDGIENSATGSIRSTDWVWNPTNHTILVGFQQTNFTDLQTLATCGDGLSGIAAGRRTNLRSDSASASSTFVFNGAFTQYSSSWGTYSLAGYSYGSGGIRLHRDSLTNTLTASPASLDGGTPTNRIVLMASDSADGSRSQFFKGRARFAILFPRQLTSAEYLAFRAIYNTYFAAGL